jgi:hypothetical protein
MEIVTNYDQLHWLMDKLLQSIRRCEIVNIYRRRPILFGKFYFIKRAPKFSHNFSLFSLLKSCKVGGGTHW